MGAQESFWAVHRHNLPEGSAEGEAREGGVQTGTANCTENNMFHSGDKDRWCRPAERVQGVGVTSSSSGDPRLSGVAA